MIICVFKKSFNMKSISFIPHFCIRPYQYHIHSGKAKLKLLVNASFITMLWAVLLVGSQTTNAEALNSDNHLTRSKIFEEKGNQYHASQCFNVFLWARSNITWIFINIKGISLNVGIYLISRSSQPYSRTLQEAENVDRKIYYTTLNFIDKLSTF